MGEVTEPGFAQQGTAPPGKSPTASHVPGSSAAQGASGAGHRQNEHPGPEGPEGQQPHSPAARRQATGIGVAACHPGDADHSRGSRAAGHGCSEGGTVLSLRVLGAQGMGGSASSSAQLWARSPVLRAPSTALTPDPDALALSATQPARPLAQAAAQETWIQVPAQHSLSHARRQVDRGPWASVGPPVNGVQARVQGNRMAPWTRAQGTRPLAQCWWCPRGGDGGPDSAHGPRAGLVLRNGGPGPTSTLAGPWGTLASPRAVQASDACPPPRRGQSLREREIMLGPRKGDPRVSPVTTQLRLAGARWPEQHCALGAFGHRGAWQGRKGCDRTSRWPPHPSSNSGFVNATELGGRGGTVLAGGQPREVGPKVTPVVCACCLQPLPGPPPPASGVLSNFLQLLPSPSPSEGPDGLEVPQGL